MSVAVSGDASLVAIGRRALAALRVAAWEREWEFLTGVPWRLSEGTPRMADLEVTLGDRPWKSHVRIAGTALELPCSNVTVTQDVHDVGRVRFEVPMTHVTLKTSP